jgi:hypothetical protein
LISSSLSVSHVSSLERYFNPFCKRATVNRTHAFLLFYISLVECLHRKAYWSVFMNQQPEEPFFNRYTCMVASPLWHYNASLLKNEVQAKQSINIHWFTVFFFKFVDLISNVL